MDRTEALGRLPAAQATALRLHETGQPDEVIATALGIELEDVHPLLTAAASELDHLDGGVPDATRGPQDLGASRVGDGVAPTGPADDVLERLATTPPWTLLDSRRSASRSTG